MQEYVEQHQDRSRNALAKSVEAAFVSWLEDLRADQAQYISDSILNLGLQKCIKRFGFSVWAIFSFDDCCLQFFVATSWTNLRAQKEVEKTRMKLVRQLEDYPAKLYILTHDAK